MLHSIAGSTAAVAAGRLTVTLYMRLIVLHTIAT